MVDVEEQPELLFFDTFSHEINEDLNLDLVQFPKPVFITEVRIIPLGARVQADFPGGVRLGATNPSKFHIDFFVNDLTRSGASSFERLGQFDYNQNDCINLECQSFSDETVRQIPTDGLVLRGCYTTITLAVYGTFTSTITEPIASPPATNVQQPVANTASTSLSSSSSISQSPIPVVVQEAPTIQVIDGPETNEWQSIDTLVIRPTTVTGTPGTPGTPATILHNADYVTSTALSDNYDSAQNSPLLPPPSSVAQIIAVSVATVPAGAVTGATNLISNAGTLPSHSTQAISKQLPSTVTGGNSSSSSSSVIIINRGDHIRHSSRHSSESEWEQRNEIDLSRRRRSRSPVPVRASTRDHRLKSRIFSRSSSRERSNKRDYSRSPSDYHRHSSSQHSSRRGPYDRSSKRDKSRDRRSPPDMHEHDRKPRVQPRTPPSNSPKRLSSSTSHSQSQYQQTGGRRSPDKTQNIGTSDADDHSDEIESKVYTHKLYHHRHRQQLQQQQQQQQQQLQQQQQQPQHYQHHQHHHHHHHPHHVQTPQPPEKRISEQPQVVLTGDRHVIETLKSPDIVGTHEKSLSGFEGTSSSSTTTIITTTTITTTTIPTSTTATTMITATSTIPPTIATAITKAVNAINAMQPQLTILDDTSVNNSFTSPHIDSFEPILSDEEIGDESDIISELDNDDIIDEIDDLLKPFNPFDCDLKKYENNHNNTNDNNANEPHLDEHIKLMNKHSDGVAQVIQKFLIRSGILEFTTKTFVDLSPDIKEIWVHTVEQVIQILQYIHNVYDFKKRSRILKAIVLANINPTIISDEGNTIKELKCYSILSDWIKIGIHFECAMEQPQPGYKIRHIKIGARLTELLCCCNEFISVLLYENQFNIYHALFELYGQNHMAISIKLMIIKAIDSCLDTTSGVNYFIQSTPMNTKIECNDSATAEDNNENGYQKVIKAIELNPSTRVKFALKSLLKKINFYNALQTIQEIVKKWFSLVKNDSDDSDKDANKTEADDKDNFDIHKYCLLNQLPADVILNDEFLLKNTLVTILKAFTIEEISYMQPKRFLPVATKFENNCDPVAAKSTAQSFQQYFYIHSFYPSILLLITNWSIISQRIFGLCLDILSSLIKKSMGIEFMYMNIEITNLIIKSLLSVNECETTVFSDTNDGDAGGDPITLSSSGNALQSNMDDTRNHQIGIEIAYKMKAKYSLHAIVSNLSDTDVLIDNLHILYTLMCNPIGRIHCINLLCLDNNILILLTIIDNEKKLDVPVPVTVIAPSTSATTNIATPSSTSTVATTKGTVIIPSVEALAESKTPIINYCIDIIDMMIRHCQHNLNIFMDHGQLLINLCKSHDLFEFAIAQTLQELSVYLRPLEIPNIFSYHDITPLCDIIKRNVEFTTTYPGELIMALRTLKYITIPSYDDGSIINSLISCSAINSRFVDRRRRHPVMNNTMTVDAIGLNDNIQNTTISVNSDINNLIICDVGQNDEPEYVELKYKCAVLKFYSADGLSILLTIIEQLNAHFEQPNLHTSVLSTNQGYLAIQILLPTIQILRKMLTYIIQCRNNQFKDLTAIEPLLKVYNLMHNVSMSSTLAYKEAKFIQDEIIKILLAYTQPTTIIDNTNDNNDLIHKSLWTQMINEIIKYLLSAPHTFLPGLLLFSELLPLPLPIPSIIKLTDVEISRIITERQLWSAHLHPKSNQITEMIQIICTTNYQPLLNILSRLCIQLADLAPNMTLIVSKSIVDLILNDSNQSALSPPQPQTITHKQELRLLNFLSQLIIYPAIKVSILSILSGKLMDLFIDILTAKQNITAVGAAVSSHQSTMAMEIVHKILQSLLNTNNILISMDNIKSKELASASALPSKELLPDIINGVIDNLLLEQTSCECQLTAMTTFLMLMENNFTIYHVRMALEKRKKQLLTFLNKFILLTKGDIELVKLFDKFLDCIQHLITPANSKTSLQQRSLSLSTNDLRVILSWTTKLSPLESRPHPLLQIKIKLDELIITNKASHKLSDPNDDISNIFDSASAKLNILYALLNEENAVVMEWEDISEPSFPAAEGIVTQYTARQIYLLYDDDINLQYLEANYWLCHPVIQSSSLDQLTDNVLVADNNNSNDQIVCDLTELAKTCLKIDANIIADCKRLLHLSSSPQSARERPITAPCFRTRRVVVEPTTGRPEKKIYVTRGRGFLRTPPARGDPFRSRPPNTSRPPSLHVDDFLALETCGAQPTGPTGYNKLSRDMINIRGTRGRGRARLTSNINSSIYRQAHNRRVNTATTWTAQHINMELGGGGPGGPGGGGGGGGGPQSNIIGVAGNSGSIVIGSIQSQSPIQQQSLPGIGGLNSNNLQNYRSSNNEQNVGQQHFAPEYGSHFSTPNVRARVRASVRARLNRSFNR